MVVQIFFENKALKEIHFPKYIFRYYRFDDFLRETIITPYLWFSKPENLNDPFDCMDVFDGNNTLEEIAWYIEKTLDYPYSHFADEPIRRPLNNFSKDMKFAKDFRKIFQKNINVMHALKMREVSVCCFSDKSDILLLWSHYSDGHKGVCIAYDTLKLIKDGQFALIEVDYHDIPPKWNHIRERIENKTTDLFNLKFDQVVLGSKTKPWSYEREHRLISHSNGKNLIHRDSIAGIILGMKMKEREKDIVADWVDRAKINTCCFEVSIDTDSYKMETFPFVNSIVKMPVTKTRVLKHADDSHITLDSKIQPSK